MEGQRFFQKKKNFESRKKYFTESFVSNENIESVLFSDAKSGWSQKNLHNFRKLNSISRD